MSQHRHDNNIIELKTYFTTVIDWVSGIFKNNEKEMVGLPWGELYEKYKHVPYDHNAVSNKVDELMSDTYIKNKKGIFEYILGGCKDSTLLDVRFFDEATKKKAYKNQTVKANANKISNCSLCAIGDNANKARIYEIKEMDADHVAAWSKGGSTTLDNCEMLCKTHNKAKGNR